MSSTSTDSASCPHCGGSLTPFRIPETSGWEQLVHLACFSDECPYYVRGWDWMWERYEARASYRYRVNPASGVASPIAVWSPAALRDRIVNEGD